MFQMSYCVGEAGKSVILDISDQVAASSSSTKELVEKKERGKKRFLNARSFFQLHKSHFQRKTVAIHLCLRYSANCSGTVWSNNNL